MIGATCREQSSTHASDSSMCGGNCASRPERASSSSRKVSRRKGKFPLASIPVADILRSYSFYSPVMSDDSGRKAQETRNRFRSANQEQQFAGKKRKIPQPETLADSDTSDHRSRSGSVQTTTNGRLGNADFGLSASYRTESVSRECIPGMDDVSVIWSSLESKDRPGRHSGEDGADNRSRFPLCKREVHTSHTMESRFTVYALMFNSSAYGGAGDGTGPRFSVIGKRASQC